MVSPTTRPAAWSARSATSPRSSAKGALLLRHDLLGRADAHPLELLAGRGDVRVAGLLGDLLGARQDVVRLAARLGEGRQALLLRALAVRASPARRRAGPARCARGARRACALTCLPNARYRITAKTRKLADATGIQKKLIASAAFGLASAGARRRQRPARRARTGSSIEQSLRGPAHASRGLQDDGEDRDDDREDAEALRERGAEDELGADLRASRPGCARSPSPRGRSGSRCRCRGR